MDIEKLKADFEQSECFKRLEHVAQYTFFEFGAYIRRTDVPDEAEKKHGKMILALILSWSAWKEAKTQEEKKLKLLLCDEHLQKCESPTGIFNTQYPAEEPCLICLQNQVKSQTAQEEEKTNAARVLCETACELLDGYAHQDAMVILDDLEQALK